MVEKKLNGLVYCRTASSLNLKMAAVLKVEHPIDFEMLTHYFQQLVAAVVALEHLLVLLLLLLPDLVEH